jgi:hypothetical protein
MDHPEQPRIKAEDILSIFLNQIELEPAERADHTQRQHA